MFSILDGREHFYQWDKDRKLIVKDGSIDKVHFCNRTGSCSLVRCVYEVNGTYLVDVPNILLQDNYRLSVYGYDRNYTKHSQTFNIVARTRPEDYVYTEEEKAQWEELEERINQIEENGVSDEAVANAIENYLTENPIETGATEEQAKQIAENTEAIEGLVIELDNYYTKTEIDALLDSIPSGGTSASFAQTYTEMISGYVSAKNGSFGTGGNWQRTDYIPVSSSDLVTFSGRIGDSMGVAGYDENKVFVASILDRINLEGGYTYENEPLTIPEGVSYIAGSTISKAYPLKVVVYSNMKEFADAIDGGDLSNYYTKAQTDEAIEAAKPDLTGYALKSDIPNVSAYQTAEQVETAINTALAGIGVAEEGAY